MTVLTGQYHAVEVLGTLYKMGCFLLIGHQHSLPEFGKLLEIIVCLPNLYLAVECLTTSHLNNHFHSYEVATSLNPSYQILAPSELVDYHALQMNHVRYGDKGLHFSTTSISNFNSRAFLTNPMSVALDFHGYCTIQYSKGVQAREMSHKHQCLYNTKMPFPKWCKRLHHGINAIEVLK